MMNKSESISGHPNPKHDHPKSLEHSLEQNGVKTTRNEVKELVHQRSFKPGTYKLRAIYKNRKGEKVELDIYEIRFYKETDESKMKEEMRGWATSAGLHNFGMDVYARNYPDGHPVTLEVRDEHGDSFAFVQHFDGSGHPINKE